MLYFRILARCGHFDRVDITVGNCNFVSILIWSWLGRKAGTRMTRYNFFQRLEREINLQHEYEKIEKIILTEEDGFYETIEEKIEECFREWQFKKNYASFFEVRKEMGFSYEHKGSQWILNGKIETINDFILYCEMILNMIFGINDIGYDEDIVKNLMDIINYDLDKLNHKIYNTEEKILIVQKDAAVSAVADIVEPDFADAIVEYNHHLLNGNLKSKQKILKMIADKLEPKRAELKSVNKTLESDFFYLVNNMNIRHNNCDISDPKNYNVKFAELSSKEKEEWYDEIYQEGLMIFLTLRQVGRTRKIAEFKAKR